MRILLDTHILLWAVAQSAQLSIETRTLLEDTDNLPLVLLTNGSVFTQYWDGVRLV